MPHSPARPHVMQLPSAEVEPAGPWLEIRRGFTRFRRRELTADRFLIGAGSNCQLQLGGDGIPMLHSILQRDDAGISIEAVMPAPPLIVDGVHQRSAPLVDGSVVEIGPFLFVMHLRVAAAAAGITESGPEPQDTSGEHEPWNADLVNLSAAELVERLAAEQADVQEFEGGRIAGAAALLQAVRGFNSQPQPDAESESQMLQELHELSQEIELRAQHLAKREAQCVERASHLLTAQDRLAHRLKVLVAQLRREPESDAPPQRAIA